MFSMRRSSALFLCLVMRTLHRNALPLRFVSVLFASVAIQGPPYHRYSFADRIHSLLCISFAMQPVSHRCHSFAYLSIRRSSTPLLRSANLYSFPPLQCIQFINYLNIPPDKPHNPRPHALSTTHPRNLWSYSAAAPSQAPHGF